MTVELGPLTTRDLFAIAEQAQTVVLGLHPVARAFA
jgi:hypothetical protein